MEKEKEKELKDKTASSQKISANGSELKEDSKFDNSEEDKNLLLKEIEEVYDRLLRAQAEVQNVRRVAAQEVTKARLFGVESLAKEFLSVGDNIQRALDSCNDESNISSVKEGLELVLKTFEVLTPQITVNSHKSCEKCKKSLWMGRYRRPYQSALQIWFNDFNHHYKQIQVYLNAGTSLCFR